MYKMKCDELPQYDKYSPFFLFCNKMAQQSFELVNSISDINNIREQVPEIIEIIMKKYPKDDFYSRKGFQYIKAMPHFNEEDLMDIKKSLKSLPDFKNTISALPINYPEIREADGINSLSDNPLLNDGTLSSENIKPETSVIPEIDFDITKNIETQDNIEITKDNILYDTTYFDELIKDNILFDSTLNDETTTRVNCDEDFCGTSRLADLLNEHEVYTTFPFTTYSVNSDQTSGLPSNPQSISDIEQGSSLPRNGLLGITLSGGFVGLAIIIALIYLTFSWLKSSSDNKAKNEKRGNNGDKDHEEIETLVINK